MAKILIAVNDIIDCAKITEIAMKYGITSVSSANCKRVKLSAIILDLGNRSMVDIVRSLNSNVPVIGFYSHVKTELKEMANKAGWVAVPRSALESKLIEVFAKSRHI